MLATLLFGFAVISKNPAGPPIPTAARLFLVAALLSFLVAAIISIRINKPANYSPLSVKNDLRRMVSDDLWNDSAQVGRQAIAEFRVGEIDRWREENGRKARRLQDAIVAQSGGVALLVVSVGVLLFRGYPG